MQPARHFLYLIDGTGLNAGNVRGRQWYSNVYGLNIAIETHNNDDSANVAFYFSGAGSTNSSGVVTRAAGIGLSDLIQQVYINVCMNFNGGDSMSDPDKIYIFGFSRGAFVAQAICRLINEYGLLYPSRINYFNEIYTHWLGQNPNLKKDSFINYCCRKDVQIEFVGLFDSVFGFYKEDKNSPLLKMVMDNDRMLPSIVKVGVHFLAIDEGRTFFYPFPWKGVSLPSQKLLQIWMAGNHSDVGGGYQDDFLSSISLHGMLDILSQETSLKVDRDRFDELTRKIESENMQDNKKCIHDEGLLIKLKLRFWKSSSINLWRRADYIGRNDFVYRRTNTLDGSFVMRLETRSQYSLPDDLKSLTIY